MDERALVARVLKGDEKAKTEFFQTHKQKLYSFCVYLMGGNDPEIEDILQEAFLAAFQKLPQFEFRSSLDTWLTQICIHKCYRHFRKRSRLVVQADEKLEALLQPKAVDAAGQADRTQDRKDKWGIVDKALEKMGGNCRKVLELRNKEGASYIEIGRILKIPIGTVMSRLARCTETLKVEVERILQEGLK
ncbi:MAG TPA: RNA polymerase sigma factor [bacterium]